MFYFLVHMNALPLAPNHNTVYTSLHNHLFYFVLMLMLTGHMALLIIIQP